MCLLEDRPACRAFGRVNRRLRVLAAPSGGGRRADPGAAADALPGHEEKIRVRRAAMVSPAVRARSRFCRSLIANADS